MTKILLARLALAAAGALFATAAPVQAQTPTAPATAPAAPDWTDAEVRKIDAEAGKITLKHAEIKHLDMPAMTMVFHVKDKAQLGSLKVGDKLKFKALQEGGKFVATEIKVAP